MAFNFGGAASTPSLFGSSSTPAFGASSTPSLFGGSSSAFGASSTPSLFGGGFGAQSSASSLFGAASAPGFGSQPAQSAGAFSFSGTAGSLFGGGGAPGFGQSQAGFGQQSAPGFLLGPGQQQQPPQSAGVLATVDNKQLTHYTKWEEINPQGQKQLLELEKLVSQTKEECRQLEECPRLQDIEPEEPSASEAMLEHTLRGFLSSWNSDEEAVAALKESVHELLHDTETAVRTFQRSFQWREAAKANQGQVLPPAVREMLSGPVVLPSHFLRKTVAAFQETVAEYRAMVTELERQLPVTGAGNSWQAQQQEADNVLTALPAALSNIHDLLYHVAAKIDALSERVEAAKAAHLQRQRQAGDYQDPFKEAERRERQKELVARNKVTVIPPATKQNGFAQPTGPQGAATGGAPGTGVLALPSVGGAFGGTPSGTALFAPASSAFGAFGQDASRSGSSRKTKAKK